MAGVSTKDIKNRIKSMESTKQITKAMEMVASSKLRRAQSRVLSSRPYFELIHATVSDIVDSTQDLSSPYLTKRSGNRVLAIVIAGDRGLAGGYNSNVLKLAMAELAGKEATVLPIGKKAVDYFRARNIPMLTDEFIEASEVSVGTCFSIAKTVAKEYLADRYDEIVVAFTNFVSVLSQTPATLRLLPLEQTKHTDTRQESAMLYEPSIEEVFEQIVPEYLGGILYGALCESQAAEHAARRTAMDSATSNAEDMIADLSLKYNRARQAAITQEITEIVAGAEA